MNYWLLKSEPDTFSFDNLLHSPRRTTRWDGVRNYQARNFLRDKFRPGDLAFFYHSSCKTPAIMGTTKIVKAAYPDPTAFDPSSPYYDGKSTAAQPRWFTVDVQAVQTFAKPLTLETLKQHDALRDMLLLRRGNRLSVLPVTAEQWQYILGLTTT